MSTVETSPSASANLRDFLLLKDDDISSAIRRGHLSTDNSTTMKKLCGSPAPRPSRTLLDMFRGEEVHPSSSSSGINLYSCKDENSRRSFEDMIRTQVFHVVNTSRESNAGAGRLNTRVETSQEILSGNGQVVLGGENDHGGEVRSPVVACHSSTPFGLLVPISIESNHRPDDVARTNLVGESQLTLSPGWPSREVLVPQMEETARQPVRCLLEALAEERDLSAREVLAREEAGGGQSPRMLLMDLLEETDRQVCFEFSEYALLEEDGKEESCGVGEANNCCVCMVRRKGAAFIPCGHTFCRLCSRELWVSRGTCPICNGSIQEVLDIF